MEKGEGEVKLIGAWPSPFVMRARIALNIKLVEYEFVVETMQPKSELLLKSNPVHKKIPVLIHHHKPISESLIIVQYIDEVWSSSGPSILPSHPYDRAIQRFWAAYVDDKVFPSMFGLTKGQSEEENVRSIQQVKEGMTLLESVFGELSKGKPFFGGDEIGYLDIALGCLLGWTRVIQKMTEINILDEANTPALVAWADRFCAHNAVKDVMPDTDKLLQFAKIFLAKSKTTPPK